LAGANLFGPYGLFFRAKSSALHKSVKSQGWFAFWIQFTFTSAEDLKLERGQDGAEKVAL
jgi:hypothetical protein